MIKCIRNQVTISGWHFEIKLFPQRSKSSDKYACSHWGRKAIDHKIELLHQSCTSGGKGLGCTITPFLQVTVRSTADIKLYRTVHNSILTHHHKRTEAMHLHLHLSITQCLQQNFHQTLQSNFELHYICLLFPFHHWLPVSGVKLYSFFLICVISLKSTY